MDNRMKSPMINLLLRVWLSHLVSIAFFFLPLLLAGAHLGEELLKPLLTLLASISYIIFCYTGIWRIGERDHNLIKYGHIKENPQKGWLSGLLSQLPGFIAAIVLLTPFGGEGAAVVFRWIYIGLTYILELLPDNMAWIYPVIPVAAAALPGIAYTLGKRGVRIRDRITHRSKPEDN